MLGSLLKLIKLRSFGEKLFIVICIIVGLSLYAYAWMVLDSDNLNMIMGLVFMVAILPALMVPSILAHSSLEPEYITILRILGVACIYVLVALAFGYGLIWLRRFVSKLL